MKAYFSGVVDVVQTDKLAAADWLQEVFVGTFDAVNTDWDCKIAQVDKAITSPEALFGLCHVEGLGACLRVRGEPNSHRQLHIQLPSEVSSSHPTTLHEFSAGRNACVS